MMKCENIGKRYGRHWLFRNFSFDFSPTMSYAIIGHNGSGKSTLLKTLTGIESINEGTISIVSDQKNIDTDQFWKYISIAAPYQELIEEFTLSEQLHFHKSICHQLSNEDIDLFLKETNLQKHLHAPIAQFSSGMKQRIKLFLAFYSYRPYTFLDEPTVNLDTNGIIWYKTLTKRFKNKSTLIICSNDKDEYDFCDQIIDISAYCPLITH